MKESLFRIVEQAMRRFPKTWAALEPGRVGPADYGQRLEKEVI